MIEEMKVYSIDIDGVLTIPFDFKANHIGTKSFDPSVYAIQKPNIDIIKKVNSLFDNGHTILLHTSRWWSDFKVTTEWLEKYEVKYHTMIMGKPLADYYIDDKNVHLHEFLEQH